MSAAFLSDPAFFTYDDDAQAYTPDARRIAEMEAELIRLDYIDVWTDALQVCICSLKDEQSWAKPP